MSNSAFPAGWVDTTLNAMLAEGLSNGRSVPTAESGFPVLRLTALDDGRIDLSERKIGQWTREEAEKYLVRSGDFLISRGNGSLRLVGRGGIVPHDDEVAFPDTMIRARVDESVIASRFLRYQWDSHRVRSQIEKAAKTTAGIYKVSQGDLQKIALVLAPLPEQHRIVAEIEKHFTRLDDAVATLERVQASLKQARASVLKAAVEGRLVPTEAELARTEGRTYEPASVLLERILAERKRKHEEINGQKKYKPPVEPETNGLPVLPEGWVWTSVEQLSAAPLTNGRSVPTREDGFSVLRLTAMVNGRIDFAEAKGGDWTWEDARSWLVEPGDFFIMRGNGSIGRVGSASIADNVPGSIAFPDTMIRLRPNLQLIQPRYLLTAWMSPFMRAQIEGSARTTAGIYKVNQGSIEAYRIPMPPLGEQRRIVPEVERRLSVLDALDQTIRQNLSRCAHLRQSILKRAFSGKLVPQDPTDEPASALLARIRAQSASH